MMRNVVGQGQGSRRYSRKGLKCPLTKGTAVDRTGAANFRFATPDSIGKTGSSDRGPDVRREFLIAALWCLGLSQVAANPPRSSDIWVGWGRRRVTMKKFAKRVSEAGGEGLSPARKLARRPG